MNKKSKAPATPLAKAFRLHGVRLHKNLTQSSSWARQTIDGEVVLTLDLRLMRLKGKTWVYESFTFNPKEWESRPANKARLQLLLDVYTNAGRRVRVIQVKTEKTKKPGVHKIVALYLDFQYWKLTRVDPKTGRFEAKRTEEDCDPVPLRYTEI